MATEVAKKELMKADLDLEDDFHFRDMVDQIVQEYRDGYFTWSDMEVGEMFIRDDDGSLFFGDYSLKEVLGAYECAQSLSEENFRLLIDTFCMFLYRKTMALEMASNRADSESRDRERIQLYGGSSNAFWRLREKYLDEFGYHRLFSNFADEYLEIGTYTW